MSKMRKERLKSSTKLIVFDKLKLQKRRRPSVLTSATINRL